MIILSINWCLKNISMEGISMESKTGEKYNVIVKSYDEKDYQEIITKKPVRYAEAVKIDRGLNINLNHNDYYTAIEKVEES